MATNVMSLTLDGGETLLVEVDAAPPARKTMKALVQPPEIDFDSEIKKVKLLAQQFHSAIADIKPLPSSFEINLGLTLKADAGIVLAKAGAEATFSITLTWGK